MEDILVSLCSPLRPRFAPCPCRGGHSSSSPNVLTEASCLQRHSRRLYRQNATTTRSIDPRAAAAARVSSPERPPKTSHGAAATRFHDQYPNHLPRPPVKPLVPAESGTGGAGTPFRDRAVFLSSLGINLFELATSHPSILSSTASLPTIRRTVHLLHSVGLSPDDVRRACTMCPEVLCSDDPFTQAATVLVFLIREAGVAPGPQLRHAIHRRPRLLASDVGARLRPTLHFLRSLGFADAGRHAPLLSCGVEEKLLPRIEFLKGIGFAPREARSMVTRFPELFGYSVEANLEPKFDYFAMEMGRDLKELYDFPEYFSFSLDRKIRPRHRMCMDNKVWLPLRALLRPSDKEFAARLQVCLDTSTPHALSPLYGRGRDRRRSVYRRTMPSVTEPVDTTAKAAAAAASLSGNSIPK